jgi:hypothetical protein
LSNPSTPEGRGQEWPNDAEPFFPSEGTFNPVVPLSEIGESPAPLTLPAVNPADVGKPAEAAWAREAHRARLKEEEETLVPSRAARARRSRPSWLAPAAVIAVSVLAGLASGSYLIWSSQHAREAPTPAQVATETPALPPAPASEATPVPVTEQAEAATKVERVKDPVKDEKPAEVAKAEKPVGPAPKQATPPQPAPRAEQVTRVAAEAKEVTPKPARERSAASTRTRPTTVAQQPTKAASSERALPISSPPPTAKSKKVIQWP